MGPLLGRKQKITPDLAPLAAIDCSFAAQFFELGASVDNAPLPPREQGVQFIALSFTIAICLTCSSSKLWSYVNSIFPDFSGVSVKS